MDFKLSDLYPRSQFYCRNYDKIEEKFKPFYRKLFLFNTDKEAASKDLYEHICELINNKAVHNIFDVINMFFMFKDQYEVIEHRYLRRNKNGDIIEYPEQMADRVATFISLAEPRDRSNGFDKLNKWYPIFLELLLDMRVSPNTPTWSSAGIPGFGCFACAVVGNGDSLEEISKWYHDVLFMNRYNFGIGHSLHKFRPSGSPFGNAKTKTKSSLKWLNVIQEMATSMQQGDSGRGGANMVSIPVWHPDVTEFINYKQYPEDSGIEARKLMKEIMNCNLDVIDKEAIIDIIDKQIPLKNFNLSVLVNNDFMRAVERNEQWEMKYELPDRSFEVKKTIPAKKLWKQIVNNAYKHGDPGLMFFDRINSDNYLQGIKGNIYSSNPCQPKYAKLLTPDGIRKLEDIDIGCVIWSGRRWTKVINKQSTGLKSVFQYRTTTGNFIGTSNHRIIQNQQKIEVSKANTIDWSVGEEQYEQFDQSNNNQDIMDGIVLGDGSIHKASKNLIYLTIGQNDHDYFKSEIKDLLIKHRPGLQNGAYEIKTTLTPDDLPYTYLRTIPNRFYYGPHHKKKAFLRGLFTANGSVSGKRITLKQTSKNLIIQVQEMLSSLGIHSYITINKSKLNRFSNGVYRMKESYDLNITTGRTLFRNHIGFIQNYKQQKIIDGNDPKCLTSQIKEVRFLGEAEVFAITVEDPDHTYWTGGCLVSNCGEQYLHEGSICNLWTINLVKHINFYHKQMNWGKLIDTINVVTRMADNLITQNEYPKEVPELEKNEKEERRIGIDYTGLADLIYVLGYKYGSNESLDLTRKLYYTLRTNTRKTSAILGRKKGNFPLFKRTELYCDNPNLTKCPKCNSKTIFYDKEKFVECTACSWVNYKYLRNLELTTQAPTGTRSRKLGVSFGIEPHFAKWWKSNVMEGKIVYNISHIFEWFLKKWCVMNNVSIETSIKLIEKADINNRLYNNIYYQLLYNWVETYDLSPDQHLKMQVVVQNYVSNAVSKTINFNTNTNPDDIEEIYFKAWKNNLKGITIYRKGSHFREVIGDDCECPECSSKDLLAIEGCKICKSCNWSKCSV